MYFCPLYSVGSEALAAEEEEEAQGVAEAQGEAYRREVSIKQAVIGGPIWLDVGNAALDCDRHTEALDL